MGELDLAFREIADKKLKGDDLERALLDIVREFGVPYELALDYWEEWATLNMSHCVEE